MSDELNHLIPAGNPACWTKGAAVSHGDRVRLWFGPPKRGMYEEGTVVGIDDGPRPGVRIKLDHPESGTYGCYATHDEVEVWR